MAFLIPFLALVLSSCQLVSPPQDYLNPPEEIQVDDETCQVVRNKITPACFEPENLRFENVFNLVIKPRCIRCHSEQGGEKGDINLETYEKIDYYLGDIEQVVKDGSMPPKKLNKPLREDEKRLILKWIEADAP